VERSGANPRFGDGSDPPKFGSCFGVGDEFTPSFLWMKELKI
jgi:hypothetical protein